ncbi:MAG: hypothetical protein H6706_16115 [Myxococcales bacterium]|nr:hypothetical protein [Myxococcales bacterium]
MRTILVTGFGPFPGVAHNISAVVARAVDGAVLGGLKCRGAVLDTSWARAWPQLEAAVGDAAPLGLILLGVAPRPQVEVERVARNRRQPRPDCDGALPAGALVADEGPAELWTTLPIGAGQATSEDAGGYLCNEVFYAALHRLPTVPFRGFVHLPGDALWAGLRTVGGLVRRIGVAAAAA